MGGKGNFGVSNLPEQIYAGVQKMILRTLFTMVFAVSIAAAAHAAVVDAIEGQGSANSGGGFQPLQVGDQLQPGTRVLAAPGSSVTISFSANCAITVLSGQSYRIPEDPNCEAVAYTAEGAPAELSQLQLLGLGLAGAGAAIGIAAIIANAAGDSADKPPKPASP